MSKLFSEKLGGTKNNKQLNILVKQHPAYDRAYICQATAFDRKKIREWMEELWRIYEPHADTNFLTEFRKHFTERSWELYLGATLLMSGHQLGKHKNVGPDFKVEPSRQKGQPVWIEAVSTTPGNGPDRVPIIKYDFDILVEIEYPEEEMLLRLTNALKEKHNKYTTYLQKNILKSDEPYVVALNRADLEYLDPQIPLIFKCLFGIGYQTLQIKNGKPLPKNIGSTWSSRAEVNKKNGNNVSMTFFINPEYAGISAVIYSNNNILNSPRENVKIGSDLVIIHNPFAVNPLPKDFLKFGQEWKFQEGYLKKSNKCRY